jgi:Fatty acid desaturase
MIEQDCKMRDKREATETSLELRGMQRAVELLRPWLLFVLYLLTAAKGWWLVAVPLAVATCLASFVQMHDAMHRSLNLSVRAHKFILSASGLLLLKSGHGLQVTHLRHHGRCLREDDPEGACASWPFYRVLLEGPFHIFIMRFYSLRTAPQTKGRQLIETAITAAVVLLAATTFFFFGSFIGIIYWAVAASLSATLPLWAAYLPHRLAPEHPAIKTAGRFAQIWTPVLTSFAYHHLHHAYPKVPTALLPVMAGRVSVSDYKAHVHED